MSKKFKRIVDTGPIKAQRVAPERTTLSQADDVVVLTPENTLALTDVLYAQILETQKSIIFGTEDEFTEIFESTEGGWVVNIYTKNDSGGEEYNEVDGGLCTGSALDAVQFFQAAVPLSPVAEEYANKKYDIEIEYTQTFKSVILARNEEHARELADELSGNISELNTEPEYDTQVTVSRS